MPHFPSAHQLLMDKLDPKKEDLVTASLLFSHHHDTEGQVAGIDNVTITPITTATALMNTAVVNTDTAARHASGGAEKHDTFTIMNDDMYHNHDPGHTIIVERVTRSKFLVPL